MTKAEKYIKENCNNKMYLVPVRFGNGKRLINFFYRNQSILHNQGYLAYVDNKKWVRSRHEVMDEVEKWLIENEGIINPADFAEENEYNCCGSLYCDNHENEYREWFKNQFPKIDLEYGGVGFFDTVQNF